MVDEYSDTPDRGDLYQQLDSHMRSSRKSEQSIHSKGKLKHTEYASNYGKVYQKATTAFQKFLDFLVFRKSKSDEYEQLDGEGEEAKEDFGEKMEELDKEEKLIHDAEEETTYMKRHSIWDLIMNVFKGKPAEFSEEEQAEQEFAEEKFEKEYVELEEQDKLLHEEENRVVRQKRGLIWSLLYKLDLVGSRHEEYEDETTEEDREYPQVTELKKDMKTVANFSVELMKKLSPHQIERIKDKEDFKKFKEVLRKNEIIK